MPGSFHRWESCCQEHWQWLFTSLFGCPWLLLIWLQSAGRLEGWCSFPPSSWKPQREEGLSEFHQRRDYLTMPCFSGPSFEGSKLAWQMQDGPPHLAYPVVGRVRETWEFDFLFLPSDSVFIWMTSYWLPLWKIAVESYSTWNQNNFSPCH